MNKIIGFLITKQKNDIHIDFFNSGLTIKAFECNGFYVYLWGMGDLEKLKANQKFSLSFPLNGNLMDRNVLITFKNENIIVENDWLGSIPVFYNPKEQIVSTISNFCIKDKVVHNEGLLNFCEFGYSVFEQTIFKDVKFMRYYSKLVISYDKINIEYKDDPVLKDSFTERESEEDEVFFLMQKYISSIEDKLDGDIILPTSGGFDSRLLTYLIKNKNRIRSFTYGISKLQKKSHEVVYAKKLSDIYNIEWEQIELNNFHKFIDEWFSIYGISTHLHGMYHIEFYKKILESHNFNHPTFLSGIIGDAWSELGKFNKINTYRHVINLGYTHGMNLNSSYLKLYSDYSIKKNVFERYKNYLKNEKIKAVFAMRTKLILISYLTQIPEYFGIPVWTPFLNFDIVKATLNIRDNRRKKRVWQKDFFRKKGLNFEDMKIKAVKSNKLNYEISKKTSFEPIDVALMSRFIDYNRLIKINKNLTKITPYMAVQNYFLSIPKFGGLLRRAGIKNKFLTTLYEYYTIKAIEKGLKYKQ